ncbi:MAG: hypothetical protein KGQ46_12295 [Hyphomicrobiales bacterium]|nr:hypothetical protein [Hyphomicrobiales bacterium]MDE2113860.1 hypothetical protein [Hyphomicrobiales bacterium]
MKRQRLNVILMVEYPRAWRVRQPGTYTMLNIPKVAGVTLTLLPNLSMHVLAFPPDCYWNLGLQGAWDLCLQAGGDQ